MSRRSSIKRRGNSGVYQARIYIPQDLQSHFKCEDKKVSLRTKDESEAKRLFHIELAKWETVFQDLRNRRNLTADDKADAIWQHYTDTLSRDDQKRQIMPTQADIAAAHSNLIERAKNGEITIDAKDPLAVLDATLEIQAKQSARQYDAKTRQNKLDALRKHLVSGETALISHEVTDYIDRNKLIIDPDSPDRADIAQKLIRAEIEALERTMERDRGDYSGAPKDPIVKPATQSRREQAKPGEDVMSVFKLYYSENPNGISQDTLNQARRDIGTFVEYIGATYPARRIDKKAVREWKALLVRFPVKATETSAFNGMKFAQIIRHNETVGKPPITPKTVNRYLSSLSAFCKWLVNSGYLENNPVPGMFLPKDKSVKTLPFSTDQMNKLFASPLFAGCEGTKTLQYKTRPGVVKIRNHEYWVPLIMAYSGARPGEIAQLDVADIQLHNDQWIMDITTTNDPDDEDDDYKSVKNETSKRIVPIHKELIRLGFLTYYEQIKQSGSAKLFPEATRNQRGQMIADFSKMFGTYIERIGVKVRTDKNFKKYKLYSLRHGVADAFRRAGYLDEQFGFILGHSNEKAKMTGHYGALQEGNLKQRVELINSISYPGLKIDHLI